MTVDLVAPAKLTLSLRIVGVRPDGGAVGVLVEPHRVGPLVDQLAHPGEAGREPVVDPRPIRPDASASATIAWAERSLAEPPGLKDSSLANSRAGQSGSNRVRPTSGVPPMVSGSAFGPMVPTNASLLLPDKGRRSTSAPGEGRQDVDDHRG